MELICLVFRLAGAAEYNQCQVQAVSSSADQFFASMKGHEAVSLASKENTNPAIHPQMNLVLQGSPMATTTIPVENAVYTKVVSVSGQYVGDDVNNLSRGIYIVNKKKVFVP